MTKLAGKRSLITAGEQGIGLAISQQLLRPGCDVYVYCRSSIDAAHGLERESKSLGRGGTADDVARAAVFFASEFDGFISGATLDINGGMYCC